jgi:2-polyprenyl-3-methyl-5-hydroxy-6-metoxy-1,4-benzoquinol methylase
MEGMIEVNCDVCGSKESRELLELRGSAYHECNQCGLIYAKWIAANYEDINDEAFAAEVDDFAAKVDTKRNLSRKKLKQFGKYKTDGNFLEIGCNAGALLVTARELGWNAHGVDISSTVAAYARDQFKLNVHTGTVESAQYPDDHFDVIYSNATLEHLQHPLSTMKECARILRPGGVMYASTVNWDSYTRQILGADWLLIHPRHHIHLFTPRNIRSLCSHADMELIKVWSTGARVQANAEGSTFKTSWALNLMKGPLSTMTRMTNKGDTIMFLATKAS